MNRRKLCGVGLVGLALTLAGCAERFDDTLGRPGPEAAAAGAEKISPSSAGLLQQSVMDFSDRFVAAVWPALDATIAAEPDVAKQVRAQRLKIALASASMTIAASKDPRANLLDMAVFISAGKWAVERYWIPGVFGESAAPLREAYAEMEREIGVELERVLTPAQRADLRGLIAAWKAANPGWGDVVNVRLRNLDGVELRKFEEVSSATGLLASVRRLWGNVDQSLLYGERMMFYLERTPLILAQQSDLTVDRVAERFPIATVNPDFDRWIAFANGLPQQFGDALAAREDVVREVLPQIQGSLASAERLTGSVQGILAATDSLAEKIERLPFEEKDYAAALDRTAASLAQLHGIVLGLNELLAEDAAAGKAGPGESRVAQLTRVLDARADRVLDGAFERVAWLLGLFFGGVVLVLIVARVLFRGRPPAGKTGP